MTISPGRSLSPALMTCDVALKLIHVLQAIFDLKDEFFFAPYQMNQSRSRVLTIRYLAGPFLSLPATLEFIRF